MARLRVSAISYLNTAPLMWNFENAPEDAELKREFEVSYTLPSACARLLQTGAADIGIIPIASYPGIPDLLFVPDVAIAALGPVRSILLVSKKPIEKINTVALDNSSRTSAVLTRLLFKDFYNRNPRFVEATPDLDAMLREHDSALLIGDPALKVDREHFLTWDLAEEWRNFTGKPFVFAFWAVRVASSSGPRLRYIAKAFQQSRDAGLNHVSELVEHWAPKLKLPPEVVREYLTSNIHYYLGSEVIEGMTSFFKYAAQSGVLHGNPELHFI